MNKNKKAVIKDKVKLEKIIDYLLENDLSLLILEEQYDLTYPQRDFILKKSMAYSRQQDELTKNYNTTDVSTAYLEIPHIIKEEYPLDSDEQKALFRRLDEIDKEHIGKRLVETNDELSRVLTALRRITGKHGSEMQLCSLYETENPSVSLEVVLAEKGIKEKKIKTMCDLYADYLELRKRRRNLTKSRDELLKKRRELIDTNLEYANIVETLVTTNVKLANWVIRELFKNIPLPKEEAQALALEGLGKAINRFDYTLGYNFSTYATKVMSSVIKSHFKELMGLSWKDYCMKKNIAYWREVLASYDKDRTLPITARELADSGLVKYTEVQIGHMDSIVDTIYNYSDYYELPDDSEIRTDDEMPITQEDYDFIDVIDDMIGIPTNSEETEREIYLPILKETLYEVLGELSEREQKVLSLRFGLEDGNEKTLEEVGKVFSRTGQRIREIEARALRKLRSPSRRARLLPFAEDFMMPKYNPSYATQDECVDAFMQLYDLRNKISSYSAKAFFISNKNLKWDKQEARNLDILLEAFITNLSLEPNDRYPMEKIVDDFCYNFGSNYKYKYPYRRIYEALKNKLSDEEKRSIDEVTKKAILADPYNIVKLALEFKC